MTDKSTNTKDNLPEELIDLINKHFPKGECKERGEAMVMLAYFMMWHKQDRQQLIQRIKKEVPETLPDKAHEEWMGKGHLVAFDKGFNLATTLINEILETMEKSDE